VPGIRGDDPDVPQAVFGGVLPGHSCVHRVGVEPYDPAGGRDGSREQVEDAVRAAAEINRRLPGAQPHAGNELGSLRPQLFCLAAQPGCFGGVGAESKRFLKVSHVQSPPIPHIADCSMTALAGHRGLGR
jgi:hypothetical protein